ncbi:crotonase [Schizothecium vesticola]|uniref:3-hydroxyisobutyryl-CoA hydrolase n=1 Tax=Schizothecium vesticola TaxID=314040 RepID=A0AA40KAM4_9PEZI|nr:crotonase [Schizothecium vesticola]
MPLRAKVLPPQQQPPLAAQMSSAPSRNKTTPRPEDDPEDVLFNTLYGLRSMELHRPEKLNALNLSMINKIEARLLEWSKSDMANVIVMKGAGDRAFCAGGDVATLAEYNKAGETGASIEYFRREYQLDHLIATYSKPYVAFMDGITMGGGVGLSMHAPFRIATERTLFAMPETTIGFFPDVGASYFLPRLPGAVGTYLALTSERLTGANVFYAGLASHYLHSTSLPALESRLAELRFADYDPLPARLAAVNHTIEEFSTGLPHDQPILLGGLLRAAIDRTFSPPTIPAIVSALEAESAPDNPHGSAAAAWAQRTLATLRERSPTSLHVTRKQMQLGARWDLETAFRREHQMAARFMRRSDFVEGVDARLVTKPPREPVWDPPSLDDSLPEDRGVDWYFKLDQDLAPLQLHVIEGRERRGLWEAGREEKPRSALFALPSENEVEELVARGDLTPKKVVERMLVDREMKQGVREVVGEILGRKTRVDEQGFVRWVYEK